MIEFKGAYYNGGTQKSKSVLVQFDGILLHIWQLADPFCRLLTSDVFRLQPALGKGKRYIKLPNGGKIETDDIGAFSSLQASRRSKQAARQWLNPRWWFPWLVGGGLALAGILMLLKRMVC